MKCNIQKYASVLLTIALTSLLCIGLYCYNNKYTHNTLQPEYGQLTISEIDLEDYHYLIQDWMFYPDILLTPDNFAELSVQTPMIYTAIGERTRFDGLGTREEPHGSGSYYLELYLPKGLRSYALELPEIFSAYRLYINGEEYTQVGNPDPERYQDRTQTKVIVFRADGTAKILISVSDYSHFYSGMVYPPVFGTPDQIARLRDIRQSVTLFAVAMGVILLTSTFYLGIATRKTNALLYALLSSVMCLVILFPFLHTFWELPIQPWYMLELTCIYIMPLLVIILHNRICEAPKSYCLASTITAFIICFVACGYGAESATHTVAVMKLFSKIVFVYKIAVAIYLLITAHLAINTGTEKAKTLYYASIAYATFFVWDRLLPSYEPIVFGWFLDWGNLILVISIGLTLLKDMATSYSNNLAFREEHRQITRQLAMQKEYTRQLSEQGEQNRRLIHDFRQHIRTISGLSEKLETTDDTKTLHQELDSYLNKISDTTLSHSNTSIHPFSGNASVDALLQYYYAYAQQNGIHVEFRLVPSKLNMTDIELCTLLGNLLENAIEACNRLPITAKKQIYLHTRETDYFLFLRVENTYDGLIIEDNHHLLSRKSMSDTHGIGMESVRDIVERHDGTMDIYPMKDVFRIGISLPLKNN